MTYIAEKSSASTSNQERQLITIEFAPNVYPPETEYSYEHPKFVFSNHVTLVNEYPSVKYTVCALELVESKTPLGKLLSQPYWRYKITDGEQTFWKDESAICRYTDSQSNTCSTCKHFQDFNEANGRGWCNQFNHQARTHHIKTNDCHYPVRQGVFSTSAEAFPTEEIVDEADLPRSEYQVGSLVKVIDSQEHHTEWAMFEVIECLYNFKLYDSTENYLNQAEWYYRLSGYDNVDTSLWVAENEICDSNMSWNVCTEDIF